MDEPASTEVKPPYLSFQTFWSFLLALASKPLPPQIDRSIMDGKSGTDQTGLLAALKFFDLIDDKQLVMPGLRGFAAADDEGRKRALEGMFVQRYPVQIEISEQNGSPKLLSDSFESEFGYTGDTRRKAMTFFLHGARSAGMTLSPHFPLSRMGSGRPATPRTKRTPTKKAAGSRLPAKPREQATEGDPPVLVSFGDAGFVEIKVNVRWLELPDETFSALRKAIKDLAALGQELLEDDLDDELEQNL